MTKRRVVVTGMGTVNPLGLNLADTWQALLQGRSGIGPISSFDASAYSTRIGGAVKNFDVTSVMSEKDARKIDLFMQYARVAAEQAVADAALPEQLDKDRVGVAIGSGIGGIGRAEGGCVGQGARS